MRVGLVVMLLALGLGPAISASATTADPETATQVCGPVPDGYVRCFSEAAAVGDSPRGFSPAAMKAAYRYPTSLSLGAGQTIGIVSAFDAPTMEADLAVFDQQYGLPACTTANGCFTTINQSSMTNPFWAFETHIDVEWAHAIAPGAKIVLVEAKTNAFGDMIAADDTAKTMANYVSNSWGSPEASVEGVLDHHFFEAPGVSWFFASGDTGGATMYPAASPYVVAVGGTRLTPVNSTYLETGWSSGGGGCSQYENASSAQAAFSQYAAVGCAGKRATPDLAADGDPATGAAVYDSQPDENNLIGWFTVGGTSLAAPIIAARAAGTNALIDQNRVYSGISLFGPGFGGGLGIAYKDIVLGNNGHQAGPGFDLVTGRGSWLL